MHTNNQLYIREKLTVWLMIQAVFLKDKKHSFNQFSHDEFCWLFPCVSTHDPVVEPCPG